MRKNNLFETDAKTVAKKINRYLKENFGYTIKGDITSLRTAKRALTEKKRSMTPNMRDAKYTETVLMLEGINKILKAKLTESASAPKVEQPKKAFENSFKGLKEYKVDKNKLSENLMKQLNVLLEGDAAEAEVTMAARGIVDELQDIIERLGKIQNDQLGPLGDEMAFTHGSAEADQFKQSSMTSVDTLMQAARAAKDEMNNAVLTISGQATAAPSMDDDMEVGADDMGADMGDDIAPDMGDDMGDEMDMDMDMGADEPLGREKR